MVIPLLALVLNEWMKNGGIPERFIGGVIKLLCKNKNKHGRDGIDNFRLLTMLNSKLKILAKVLANRLQAVLSSLIGQSRVAL